MSIVEQLYLDSLRRTQWYSPERLRQYQRPMFERILRHAAAQTEFHRERLRPLFLWNDFGSAPIDFSRWGEVPIFSRAEAAKNFEPLCARTVPPEAGEAAEGESSGSTTIPLKHLRSAMADSAGNCVLERIYEIFDLDVFGVFAILSTDRKEEYPYPHGAVTRSWSRTATNNVAHILDIGSRVADQLEWLERKRPDHVMTYPVTMMEIAETALTRGGTSLRLKSFLSTGEMLDQKARDIITRTFGCKVIDIYGMREIGPVAFQCPEGDGYHVNAELLHFELLDDRNQPVPPGEFGRIIVTPFYNFAMPFIRYDVGDYGMASATPCRCGRGLPLVTRIGGRARTLFAMPDGTRRRLRGTFVADLAKFISYRYVQLVQIDRNTIEIRYVPVPNASEPDLEVLTREFRAEIHPRVEVRLVPVDHVPRGAGMKLEQLVSLVET